MIQNWQRDEGPCIALGSEGAFDDMHLFAPCVAYEDGVYSMWYSGSRHRVSDRDAIGTAHWKDPLSGT